MRIGQEDAIVGRVVVAMAHALHHSDDLEANVVQHDGAADRRSAAGEQVLHHLVADHAHEPLLGIVGVVQPAATVERQIANGVEVRRDAHHLPVGVAELADLANVLPHEHRRDGAHMRRLALDVKVVLIGEVILAAGTHIAGDSRRAPRER